MVWNQLFHSNGLKSPKICLKHTKTAKFCWLSKFHTMKSNNYQKRMILDYQLKMTAPVDDKKQAAVTTWRGQFSDSWVQQQCIKNNSKNLLTSNTIHTSTSCAAWASCSVFSAPSDAPSLWQSWDACCCLGRQLCVSSWRFPWEGKQIIHSHMIIHL